MKNNFTYLPSEKQKANYFTGSPGRVVRATGGGQTPPIVVPQGTPHTYRFIKPYISGNIRVPKGAVKRGVNIMDNNEYVWFNISQNNSIIVPMNHLVQSSRNFVSSLPNKQSDFLRGKLGFAGTNNKLGFVSSLPNKQSGWVRGKSNFVSSLPNKQSGWVRGKSNFVSSLPNNQSGWLRGPANFAGENC